MLDVAVVEHFEVHHVVLVDAQVLSRDDDGEFEDAAAWEGRRQWLSRTGGRENDRPPMSSLRLPGSSCGARSLTSSVGILTKSGAGQPGVQEEWLVQYSVV